MPRRDSTGSPAPTADPVAEDLQAGQMSSPAPAEADPVLSATFSQLHLVSAGENEEELPAPAPNPITAPPVAIAEDNQAAGQTTSSLPAPSEARPLHSPTASAPPHLGNVEDNADADPQTQATTNPDAAAGTSAENSNVHAHPAAAPGSVSQRPRSRRRKQLQPRKTVMTSCCFDCSLESTAQAPRPAHTRTPDHAQVRNTS